MALNEQPAVDQMVKDLRTLLEAVSPYITTMVAAAVLANHVADLIAASADSEDQFAEYNSAICSGITLRASECYSALSNLDPETMQ